MPNTVKSIFGIELIGEMLRDYLETKFFDAHRANIHFTISTRYFGYKVIGLNIFSILAIYCSFSRSSPKIFAKHYPGNHKI